MAAGRFAGSQPSLPSEQSSRIHVPNLVIDPIWSIRQWPAVVHLARRDFIVPAMPAADWLMYLMQNEPDLDSMIADLLPEVDELLINEVVDLGEVYECCLSLIETVASRKWWVALRIIHVAKENWHILGPEMLQAVDAERVSLSGWLDVALIKMLQNMAPDQTAMFSGRLEAPPPEVMNDGPPLIEEMEMDASTFLSLQ